MFTHARIKLTILYSLLFLSFFAILSTGIYVWMERSLGEGYFGQVQQAEQAQSGPGQVELDNERESQVVAIAGDVALRQLKNTLFAINSLCLFIIPMLAWFLTKRTLSPVQESYIKQKQFVSDASHELKTPLSVIQGELEVILKRTRTPTAYQKAIRSAREEITRLNGLVESLLLLARADTSNNLDVLARVDLTDVVNSVRSELAAKIKHKKIRICLNTGDYSIVIPGNITMIHQLFYNIIDNAVKYTPPGGNITIQLTRRDNSALCRITDSGIGVPLEDQEKIFDRFYRVDASRSHTKGYGLGLSIAKTIVEKHKGTISVTSSGEKKGSTFIVALPLHL